MSRGTKLQKMEEEVKQSKTAVNANAKPAEPMKLREHLTKILEVQHLKTIALLMIVLS